MRINLFDPFIRKMVIQNRSIRFSAFFPWMCLSEYLDMASPDSAMSSVMKIRNPHARIFPAFSAASQSILKKRIKTFHPDYRSESPEKAIQKVNSAAQIKWNFTVIPEHSPKNHLGEDTADILISSSQQRSVNKNKTVTSVSVLIENCCQKHAAKSPYNAEWSEHNTAAAHNNTVLHITEDRLYHISKKGSQEKMQTSL